MGFYITPDSEREDSAAEIARQKTATPVPDALSYMDKIKALIDATHGPEIGAAMVRYGINLANAVKLSAEIEQRGVEAGADPEQGGLPWDALAEEIRSAAASYRTAAEALGEFMGTKACTTSLLSTLPPLLLGRIIQAGLECEADGLENLISTVCPPPAENASSDAPPQPAAPGCGTPNTPL